MITRTTGVRVLCCVVVSLALGAAFSGAAQASGNTVALSLSPTSIVADGQSISTAIARVRDSTGNPLPNETVQFSSTDTGQAIGPVENLGDGTYSTTITSSTTVGTATITASDGTTSATASLTQVAVPTATFLSAPTSTTTNQQVTLIATVSAGRLGPSGGVVFKANGTLIKGCAVLIAPSVPIARCQTAFNAADGSPALTATFIPFATTSLAGSTSTSTLIHVGKGSTTTSLSVSRTTVPVDEVTVYTATVTPLVGGAAKPSGVVSFFDGASMIGRCGARAVGANGTAQCGISYPVKGVHQITARYTSDTNFLDSSSTPAQQVKVGPAAGTVSSTMQWTFFYTSSHTQVRALSVNGAPRQGRVILRCHGRGCPFGRLSLAVPARSRPFSLTSKVGAYQFPVGTRLAVAIVHTNWIGKYYSFTIRPGRPPTVSISCLAPGRTQPGGAC